MLNKFERAVLAHLIADWLLQNDWMAKYKSDLKHPASWLHGLVQFLFLSWALSWRAALPLTMVHLLIDTRIPVKWWQGVFGQTTEGPAALHVAIWDDQILHVATIALWLNLVEQTEK
jgi:hypothetical protein